MGKYPRYKPGSNSSSVGKPLKLTGNAGGVRHIEFEALSGQILGQDVDVINAALARLGADNRISAGVEGGSGALRFGAPLAHANNIRSADAPGATPGPSQGD